MNKNNFVSELIQIIGFMSAITVSLSQYFFRDNFKTLFEINSKLYGPTSLIALIISLSIIIGLFANRYNLSTKFYLSNKYKIIFLNAINENNSSPEILGKSKKLINEPFSYSFKKLSILSIILAIVSYLVVIATNKTIFDCLFYILFICFSVISISIFSIQIYLEKEFAQREEQINEQIFIKIKDYFAKKITIKSDFKNISNWQFPQRHIEIEYDKIKYKITCDANNPDRFFNIEEIINK